MVNFFFYEKPANTQIVAYSGGNQASVSSPDTKHFERTIVKHRHLKRFYFRMKNFQGCSDILQIAVSSDDTLSIARSLVIHKLTLHHVKIVTKHW